MNGQGKEWSEGAEGAGGDKGDKEDKEDRGDEGENDSRGEWHSPKFAQLVFAQISIKFN